MRVYLKECSPSRLLLFCIDKIWRFDNLLQGQNEQSPSLQILIITMTSQPHEEGARGGSDIQEKHRWF